MKVLSLFDGIGTGRLSLERAGINVDKYYASEIDKNAITIAKTNYSDIIELGSVLNWRNWCVENVIPYYKPLIEPTAILQRHLFWSNKPIANKKFEKDAIRTKNKISDFDNYEVVVNSKISNKRQVLRNCVKPEIGLYILSEILK